MTSVSRETALPNDDPLSVFLTLLDQAKEHFGVSTDRIPTGDICSFAILRLARDAIEHRITDSAAAGAMYAIAGYIASRSE